MTAKEKNYTEGQHDGIKKAISTIIEFRSQLLHMGYKSSPQLGVLQNKLSMLVEPHPRLLDWNVNPCDCDQDAQDKARLWDKYIKEDAFKPRRVNKIALAKGLLGGICGGLWGYLVGWRFAVAFMIMGFYYKVVLDE